MVTSAAIWLAPRAHSVLPRRQRATTCASRPTPAIGKSHTALRLAQLTFKMHLREPQQREYETPNAEPEHDDDHLAKAKLPVSVSKVRGNGCHQVNVADGRQRKQRQCKNRAKVSSDPRTQEREPTDLRDENRPDPEAPPSKSRRVRSDAHIEN